MSKGKLEGVNLIKVCCDTSVQYLNYEGWHFEGTAIYKIGLKRYKCEFIAGENLKFHCAFLDRIGNKIPEIRLQREALLTLIYGEIQKYLGRAEMICYFKEERKKEEEERRRKEEEEKAKKIALGEQISIEKYLKNL